MSFSNPFTKDPTGSVPAPATARATLRNVRDVSGSVVSAIVTARRPAAGARAADVVAGDVEALRLAARIARAADGTSAFVAASSTTVKSLDPVFAHALKACAHGVERLGVLIRCPVDVEEAAAALHFASLCVAQGARLALELPENVCAGSWSIACSVASAIDASVVILTGRTIVKLYGGRGARGARERVTRLVRPGVSLYATAIDGPALQALCERVGACGFEFARSSPAAPILSAKTSLRAAPRATTAAPTKAGKVQAARFGLIAAAALSMAACSSVPKPAVPDGSIRVPVNDPGRIAILQKQTELQIDALQHDEQMRGEVSALRHQVQELRTAVKLLAVAPQLDAAQASSGPAAPMASLLAPIGKAAQGSAIPLAANLDSRAVEATHDGLIFRVFHPTGAANFAPTGKLAEALRAAATAGSVVEVRGFTDSPVDDGPNRRVAWARSNDARQWLLDQGIDGKQIRCHSTSHGHFLSDNTTPAGRTLNRRVEIEIHGDTTQAVAILNRKEG